jgi:Ca2+-binding EF-hand superfamily protein
MSGTVLQSLYWFAARRASKGDLRAKRPCLRGGLQTRLVFLMSFRRTLLLSAATICIVGCSKKSPVAPSPQTPQAPATEKVESPAQTEAENSTKTAADESVASKLPAEKPPEDPPKKVEVPPERFAILTPGGPLLVDVTLSLDGQSPSDLFAARVKQVLEAADTDNDKRSTWAELAANEEFLKAERVMNPATVKGRTKTWTEQHDVNRDKLIQPEEASSWLGRDSGRSVTALALRSRRAYYSSPSLSSRVWQLLDVDNDGRLTAAEITAAPDRFLLYDANDDRIITTAEMAPLREQLNDPGRPSMSAGSTSRKEDRYAALHLKPPVNWSRIEYLLADLYAPRQPLSPSSFPDLPQLFDHLDVNADGRVNQEELANLLTIKPHLQVNVSFLKLPEIPIAAINSFTRELTASRIDVQDYDPVVTNIIQPTGTRLVFSLGNTRITISANDLATPAGPGMYVERSALRVMVHDDFDAVFEQIDADSDGRLGERELSNAAERMLTRDKNGDGEISGAELPAAMIVAFLRSESTNEQSFYVPPSNYAAKSTGSAPPWFAQADFNGDGDVSRREFLGSSEQFAQLDGNGDGFISADEASVSKGVSAGR